MQCVLLAEPFAFLFFYIFEHCMRKRARHFFAAICIDSASLYFFLRFEDSRL